MSTGKYRYKVTVTMKDPSGTATFVLWDKECKEIMGMSATKMREIMIKRTKDDRKFPKELKQELLSKTGLFETVLRNASLYTKYQGPRSFGVLTMITDPKTIAKYKSPAAVKDEMDGWNGFDFSEFNREQAKLIT
ncbi:unnamed protein product [Cuscuta campestris]|uniref:Replication factor A C-terminal domain-containing protein n=1 Tax=Cuscuta campestris TaxID=132261 RepID=A0A484L051_9ASTE|nr:unnamed protein product [Cuscuta campestris]